MPLVTEERVDALAHCVDSRCQGNRQQPVKAVRQVTTFRFTDSGGDQTGPEKTSEHLRLEKPDKDGSCPHCGKHRDVTMQERPRYDNLSGHPQDGILTVKLPDGSFVQPQPENTELAELKAQVAALTEALAKQATKAE